MLYLLRKKPVSWCVSLMLLGLFQFAAPHVQAQMHHGNLIVCSPTGGTSAASVVKLYQYTTAGSLVDSTVIPSTGANELTESGSASSEGQIALSAEKDRIIVVGYASPAGTLSVASTTVNRVIGTVDSTETFTLQYSQPVFSGNNIRCGTSYGSNFFATGALSSGSGVMYMNTATLVETASSNNRAVDIYAGNLYFTSGSGSYIGVNEIGASGISTASGQSVTLLTTGAASPYAFSISPNGLTMYVADATNGILKFTRATNSGAFTAAAYTVYGTACSGITVDYTTANPTIYAIPTTGLSLISFQDAGSTVTSVTTLATTTSTQYFRSVAFAPSTYGSISGSTSICAGGTGTINFTGNPHGIISYSVNGTPQTIQLDSAYGMASVTTGTLSATTTFTLGSISTPFGTTQLSGSAVITVASPSPIVGNTTCVGSSTTLTDGTPGGTWSSASTSVATVGSSTGIMTGATAGTVIITYAINAGCQVTTTATILPAINLITGSSTVCALGTTTLGDLTPSGTWTSSNTSAATVGATTGVVTGGPSGTTIITYTSPAGCMTTATETVIPSSAGTISGYSIVCTGTSTPLVSSIPGGIWSSTNTGVAAVGSATGSVTGVAAGSAIISYSLTNTCGAFVATYNITDGTVAVPAPTVTPSTDYICPSSPAQLLYAYGDTLSGSVIVTNSATTFTIPVNVADSSSVTVGTIPAGAVITSIAVTVNVGNTSGAYQSDNLFNLRAPNGTIINLDNFHGASNAGFTNVTFSSAGTVAQSSALLTTGNQYIASLVSGAPTSGSFTTTGYRSNTTSWSSMYSVPNGQWTLITDNDYNATEDTLKNWTLTINYAYIPTVTWSPAASLYTNTGGSISYVSGSNTNSVYALPASTTTYTVTANVGGCTSTRTAVVNYMAALPAITGNPGTCVSSSTTLADAIPGGAWSSASTGVATVGTNGVVTGVATGSAVISYSLNNCVAMTAETVVAAINPITNGGALCALTTTTLGDLTPSGTWSSSNPSVASIGSTTGVVSGIAGGTAAITYTSPVGCTATVSETVTPLPISGNAGTCIGSSTTLGDGTTGGTWVSSNIAAATVGSTTGVVNGVALGTSVISYVAPGGCIATVTETVAPAILPITGTGSICATFTTTLGDLTTGGTWQSTNTSVASIGTSNGVLSAGSFGTAVISYTSPVGCISTATENVLPNSVLPITGSTIVCLGSSTQMADLTPGGLWSSTNPAIASVGSTTGLVTGNVFGTTTISYTVTNMCGSYTATFPITVTTLTVPTPVITPMLASFCPSSTAALISAYADTITGSVTLTSTNPFFLEPVNAADSSTINVTGIPAGAVITGVSATLNVHNTTSAYQSDNLYNLRAPNGTIINLDNFHGSSGAGFAGVTFSSAGTLAQSSAKLVSGNLYIASLVSGAPTSGSFTTTQYRSNATSWSSLYSIANGPWTLITDNDYNATEDSFFNWTITINYAILPSVTWSPVAGLFTNPGATTSYTTGTNLGAVYALPASSTVYTVTANMGGCTSSASVNAVVNPTLYVPSIGGPANACVGTTTAMVDSTTGGTWVSSNTAVATIGSQSGVLNGVSGSTVIITYNYSSGSCSGYSTRTFTVNALPVVPAISGSTNLCYSSSVVSLLSDASLGGTWTSSNPSVATIGLSSGVVNAIAPGTSQITYVYSNGTCSNSTTTNVTVANTPSTMSVTPTVASLCPSSSPQVLVASGGNIPGSATVSSGTISFPISYAASYPAGLTTSLTVTGVPAGATVTGISVNYNATASFDGDLELNLMAPNAQVINLFSSGTSNSGGNFVNTTISSAGATAIPNSAAGAPWTGVWAANAAAGKGSSVYPQTTATWSPLESANPNGTWVLVGRDNYSGNTATLTNWSITINYAYQVPVTWLPVTGLYTNTSGTVAYTGTATNTVYALPGTSTMYTATGSNGACVNSSSVEVYSSPTLRVPAIAGNASVCMGSGNTLTDSLTGGTWASTNNGVAMVGSLTGIVTPVAPGTATMVYTYTNGSCSGTANKVVTVNALPSVASIAGPGTLCSGSAITLTDATTGGTWSTGTPGIVAVGSTGVVTPITTGAASVTYTYSNGTCSNMATTAISSLNTPTPISISAASPAICAAGPADRLMANGGMIAGSVTASSVSAPFVEGNFTDANTSPISITTIPSGSIITGVSVTYTINGTGGAYQSDNIVNLEAPNGNIINLDYEGGIHAGGYNFTNVMISSTGTTAINTALMSSGNNYAASLQLGQGPTSPTDLRSTATTWSSLYSVPDGTWTLVPTNDYSATEDTFKNWSITINYLAPATTVWANNAGLFTNAGATIAYTGSSADSVFALPAATSTYTVTASNGTCTSSATQSITVNPMPTAITGTAVVCQNATSTLGDGLAGGEWSSNNMAVATVGSTSGTLTGITPGTAAVTYAIVATGCSTTVMAVVNALPNTHNLTGGGHYCLSGSGVDIGLNGSDTGVHYDLYNGATMTGSVMPGTGSALDFGLTTAAGDYTIVGINNTTGCNNTMNGTDTIVVNALPTVYNVINGGSFCAGGTGVHVGLSGSETGIKYQLYHDAAAYGSPFNGNGAALDFGLFTTPGSYTVEAMDSTTACEDNMSLSADIIVNPLPAAYAVSGTGSYCSGGAGRHIMLSGSNYGITYQLYNNGSMLGGALHGIDGALDFGSQTDSGIYTVVAMDTATLCANNMNDTATISINPLPATHTMTGGGSYCPGGSGVLIGLNGSNPGIRYQLFNGITAVGAPMAGTSSALNFGPQTATGLYSIVATDTMTLCTNNMAGTDTVSLRALPSTYSITGSGSYCSGGTGVDLTLAGSATGVKYQLYYLGSMLGSSVMGTGASLDLGFHTGAGGYTVVATDTTTTCSTGMGDTATIGILSLPPVFNVTGGGGYCSGGTGVNIGLSGSDTGIKYQLFHGLVAIGSPLSGSGASLTFGADTAAGIYKVVATNNTTACKSNMNDSAIVIVHALPTVFTVTGGGGYCASGSGEHVNLSGSQTGVSYRLYDGGSSVGSPMNGTGSGLDFGLHTAAGVYTVTATDTTYSCVSGMSSSATITVLPLPAMFSVTGGGSYCAGGTGVHVRLASSSVGVTYQMYYDGSSMGSVMGGTGSLIDFGAVTAAGEYTIKATDTTNGCTDTMTGADTVVISPVLSPSVTITSGMGGTVCTGTMTTFMALGANGGGSPVYQWKVDGFNMGTDSTSFSYIPVNGDVITAYLISSAACVAYDTAYSDTITMNVLNYETPTVHITAAPTNEVCESTPVTFSAATTWAGSAPTFEWLKNGVNSGSDSTFTYTPANGDAVSCILVSNYGCRNATTVYSNGISLDVVTPIVPSVVVNAYPGAYISKGQKDSLVAIVTNGGSSPTYQWYIAHTAVAGATTSTFVFDDLPGSGTVKSDSVSCLVTRNDACGLSTFNGLFISVSTLGVAAVNNNAADVAVIPNPNKGEFTIKGSLGTTASQDVTMEITDLLGQVIYTGTFTATNGEINEHVTLRSSIANGMYILNLHSGSMTSVFHVVVEQ